MRIKRLCKRLTSHPCMLAFSVLMLLFCAWAVFRFDLFVAKTGKLERKRMALYLAVCALPCLLSLLPVRIRQRWNARARAVYALVAVVIMAVCMQYAAWLTPMPNGGAVYVLLQLSIAAVILMAVWLLVWDMRIAAPIACALMTAAGYAYRCVYLFRGVTFKPMDILSIQTAAAVAGQYEYTMVESDLLALTCFTLLCVMAAWLPRQKPRGVRFALGKGACIAAAAAWMCAMLFTPLLTDAQVETTAFEQSAFVYHRKQGVLPTLMREVNHLTMNKPDGYTQQAVNALRDELDSVQPAEGTQRPNVIVIMNESLTDFSALWQFDASQDALPFMHSLTQNAVYGNLYVSSYGGSTCNTEHSFLTGTPPAPLLNMPLMSIMQPDTPSLAWQLKGLGYRTIAMHPFKAQNYQRDVNYPKLGFDAFLSEADFEDPHRLRGFVSDAEDYGRIIRLYEEKAADERLFVFNVTMQNHSPYNTGDYDPVVVLGESSRVNEWWTLQEYLNCIYQSDLALEQLVAYFQAQEEPTVILVFGDHQPFMDMSAYPMAEGLSEGAKRLAQHITSFVIWANYPIEGEYVEAVSINYLAALLLEKSGLPMTAYDVWQLHTAVEYPVVTLHGYMDAQGAFTAWEHGADTPDMLKKLDLLRYNRLYDAQNRISALDVK